jgi:hypothetical protein
MCKSALYVGLLNYQLQLGLPWWRTPCSDPLWIFKILLRSISYISLHFNNISFLKKKSLWNRHNLCVCVCVCVSLYLNQLTDFHQTWNERYALRLIVNLVPLNFMQSVLTIWRTCEHVTWATLCMVLGIWKICSFFGNIRGWVKWKP